MTWCEGDAFTDHSQTHSKLSVIYKYKDINRFVTPDLLPQDKVLELNTLTWASSTGFRMNCFDVFNLVQKFGLYNPPLNIPVKP